MKSVKAVQFRPDYNNTDPVAGLFPDFARMHSRIGIVPSLGQGEMKIDGNTPPARPLKAIEALETSLQEQVRSALSHLLNDEPDPAE